MSAAEKKTPYVRASVKLRGGEILTFPYLSRCWIEDGFLQLFNKEDGSVSAYAVDTVEYFVANNVRVKLPPRSEHLVEVVTDVPPIYGPASSLPGDHV